MTTKPKIIDMKEFEEKCRSKLRKRLTTKERIAFQCFEKSIGLAEDIVKSIAIEESATLNKKLQSISGSTRGIGVYEDTAGRGELYVHEGVLSHLNNMPSILDTFQSLSRKIKECKNETIAEVKDYRPMLQKGNIRSIG